MSSPTLFGRASPRLPGRSGGGKERGRRWVARALPGVSGPDGLHRAGPLQFGGRRRGHGIVDQGRLGRTGRHHAGARPGVEPPGSRRDHSQPVYGAWSVNAGQPRRPSSAAGGWPSSSLADDTQGPQRQRVGQLSTPAHDQGPRHRVVEILRFLHRQHRLSACTATASQL